MVQFRIYLLRTKSKLWPYKLVAMSMHSITQEETDKEAAPDLILRSRINSYVLL